MFIPLSVVLDPANNPALPGVPQSGMFDDQLHGKLLEVNLSQSPKP